MKKPSIRLLSLLLCGALLCSMSGGLLSASADSVKDLEEKLEDLEQEAADYRDKIDDTKDDLESAQTKKEYYDKQIALVSEQITLLTESIDELNDKIDDQNDRIEEAEAQLAEQNEAIAAEYQRLQQRMRALAKTGNVTLLQMLLDTGSYTDYLLKSKAMSCIAESEQTLMAEMEQELSGISSRKEELETQKAALEEEKADVQALKKKSDAKKAELDSLCNERKALVDKLENDLDYLKAKLKKIEQAEAEADARLNELLKQESTVSGEVTLPFFWPTPTCTVITSVFGPRGQIGNLNTSSFHRGYDIARYGDAAGEKIYAAESGVVITAERHWSYGIYVEIDHGYDAKGRRIVTRYAHMSKRYVSVGDKVTRGKTVLGLVGETGQASGAHLHFETRVDGEAVDSIKKGYLVKPR